MTIDERIERLVTHQEKTQTLLADIVATIGRLERIALPHSLDIEEIRERLDELEQRRARRKPQ